MKLSTRAKLFSVCTLVVVIALAFFGWMTSPFGLEVANDSTVYIRGALNLHQGKGFTMAGSYINHFPVGLSYLYHILLFIFPGSINEIVLGLHFVLLGSLAFGMIYIMRCMHINALLQPLVLLAFLLSVPITDSFTKILTELPFLAVVMMATWPLFRLKPSDNNTYIWIYFGFVWAAGFMLRFAAIGFLAAYVIWPFIVWRNCNVQNAKRVIAMIVPFTLCILAYKWHVSFKYNTSISDRVMQWHPISVEQLIAFPSTLITWLLDYEYLSKQLVLILVPITGGILLWLFYWGYQHKGQTEKLPIPLFPVLGIISAVYCLFLVTSISLFDAWTPVNTRLLSPLAIYFFIGLAYMANWVYKRMNRPLLCLFLFAVLLCTMSLSSIKKGIRMRKYPEGYNTPYWNITGRQIVNDTTCQWICAKGAIYTNAIPFFIYQNNRAVSNVPFKFSPITKQSNALIEKDIKGMVDTIGLGQAQLVFFSNLPSPPYLFTKDKLLALFSDGQRFRVKQFEQGFVVQKAP